MESEPASPSTWHHFLRATGLRGFERLFYKLFGQVAWLDCEPPKPIFYNSRGSVFARLGVHLLPILTSVTIISLNLGGLYHGRDTLPGPAIDFSITSAMLQVVAKLQELLIVASLTSIVFSVIRDQLVSTMGVPLGLLFVGFMFSHLSFFWSMEFWGTLRSQLPLRTKIFTALLLAAAGIIFATAGPFVAVLLVPRIQDWDASGSPSTGLASNVFQFILDNSGMLDQHLNHADNPTETWNGDKDGSFNRTLYMEWITTLIIASGISRHGIDGALNMTGDARSWSLLDYTKRPDFNERLVTGKTARQQPNGTEFTSFFTSISINGIAYKANSATDNLAIAVLLAHMVMVLDDSVYLVYTRRSSDAWDSVMEMLILAHNSQPTSHALRNTSAGIRSLQRFKKLAVVRVTRPEDADAEAPIQSDGRVELVVHEDEEILGTVDQQVSMLPDQTVSTSTSTTAIPLLPQQGQAASKDSGIRSRKLRDPGEFQKVQPDLAHS
ncbi:hypothetical protein CEP54_006452 [Fusarium duplospermum]|uniref:Uncharacterized protein n=1 Tax=Fusarium duplospermum TaxID=1325734 RepID=A0A428Q6U2_9HYPO|nr:hypothetical protein CEP54_006452 [Fusarium duplospermum]